MNLRFLQYFLTVAREETISGAAGVLHVTQPTLSRQMMELEEELGVKLFIRGNRKITLTEDGLLLRKRAQEIVELVEKTEAELSVAEGIVSGDIFIGSGETYAIQPIGDVIKELQEDHPQLRFHFSSGNEADVTERLDKGLLDFGILIEPANLSKYDSLRLPEVDVWGVYMRKDSPLASLDVVCPEDLFNVPLLLSRQWLASQEISNWFRKEPEKLNIVATYNLIFNASVLVEKGIGYAISLDKLINTTGDHNLCFRPLEPRLEAHVDIVWKKYQVFSKSGNIFIDRIQRLFNNTTL